MNQSLLFRGILIALVVGIAVFSATPPDEKINLGLDLQGGMHLVLKVKTNDALRSETDHDMDRFVSRLKDEGVENVRALRPEGEDEAAFTSFHIDGLTPEQVTAARKVHDNYFKGTWDLNSTGGNVVLTMNDAYKRTVQQQSVDQALRTIRNRIDQYGVSEPVIQRQGFSDSDRIVLQLPGVDDPERVKHLIQQTAFLEWHLSEYPREGGFAPSREAILEHYGGQLPPNVEILEGEQRDRDGNLLGKRYLAVQRTAVVTGRDLKNAKVSAGQFNEPVVAFTLDYEKGQAFGDVTSSNLGRGLAIVLDNVVISAPTIRGRIRDEGVIEGNFTQEEASDLSTALRSGALPAGIETLEERTVGPSLGQDSIDQGLRAGLYGAAFVVVTMLVVYLLAGINAIFVLTLNVFLVFGMLAAFHATLTLPGIAGIILTI
ncbi:MAG: protein translocase subunit SecD, partial [Acidobacteria bacterium]|nr:protein translocase subunit SecD [Acidobacteriota bacterium]